MICLMQITARRTIQRSNEWERMCATCVQLTFFVTLSHQRPKTIENQTNRIMNSTAVECHTLCLSHSGVSCVVNCLNVWKTWLVTAWCVFMCAESETKNVKVPPKKVSIRTSFGVLSISISTVHWSLSNPFRNDLFKCCHLTNRWTDGRVQWRIMTVLDSLQQSRTERLISIAWKQLWVCEKK